MTAEPRILAEISPGELIDKITILEIKSERLSDAAKLANVRYALERLRTTRALLDGEAALPPLEAALKAVNAQLWQIEDEIRDCERRGDFGPAFVALARQVYRQNDRRAELKKAIDRLYGSAMTEEKSYRAY
ncbi:MAG TPA: DUF6165 family protein [Kiloniellales bacterium]|nr:DUF6165 family protein [Kiloniellales bacterium]